MIHQKILALMEGCSSAKPVPFDELVEKSGLFPDTLRMVLSQMQQGRPATVNSCILTRDGKSRTVYWPTGAIAGALSFHEINKRNWERELNQKAAIRNEEVQPNASKPKQELTMNQENKQRVGSKPSELNQCLYNEIVEHPGIAHAELVTHALNELPDATEKQVVKTLSNMRHVTRKIRIEGERGNYRYHLNIVAVMQPEKPRMTGSEAEEPRAARPADELSMFIDDKNNLCLSTNHLDLELNQAQTARLQRFLGRIQMEPAA